MISAWKSFWGNAFNFSGRTRRRDYWLAVLMNVIVAGILGGVLGGIAAATEQTWIASLGSLYSLAILIPSISLTIRRLHDVGKSGWWYLICMALSLVCGLGSILMIVFSCMDSKPDNQWGPNPKGMSYQNPYAQNPYGGPYQQ